MKRDEMILKLHGLYTGKSGGQYLCWLESQSDDQLTIYLRRATKHERFP